ncbi:DUF6968 family protein [Streptomyces sp. 12297]|uniref:DUF6968 family protein n=1 Tax=Streptomyces sp. NBC_00239 TaxID=2903640 RepID=UPI002E293A3E|nr:hypothetical protein [Streptomyces sp. NBC_00239]
MVDRESGELGEPVVSRALTAEAADGTSVRLSLELWPPRPDPDPAGDWICPCRIAGLGEGAVWEIHGIDGLQAVQLALKVLQGQLDAAAEERGLTFGWLGAEGLTADEIFA